MPVLNRCFSSIRDKYFGYATAGRFSSAKMDFKYPHSSRIKKSKEFKLVQEKGKKLHARNFLVVVSNSSVECSRLGVVVTRKLEKRAVYRNRIKRRIREIFRLNRFKLKGDFDIVVIAKRDALECSYQEMERQIFGALAYHGYLGD